MVMLDDFAEWGWTVGSYCRPAGERILAGAKGVGAAAFMAFGGQVAGKVIGKLAGKIGGSLGGRLSGKTASSAGGAGWNLPPKGGANIGGRWYTEHALERMAPRTPEVMAQLEMRALSRAEAAGLRPGTPEFKAWWGSNGPNPRGIPPMVIESEIAFPGTSGVRVITGGNGQVITVIPNW